MTWTKRPDAPTAAATEIGVLAKRGGAAVLLAVVVNGLVVIAADAVGVAPGLEPLAIGPVTLFTALGVVGATVVYAVVERVAARPRRTFVGLAAVVLALSIVPDVVYVPTMANATVAGAATLALLHVTTAVIAVGILLRERGP